MTTRAFRDLLDRLAEKLDEVLSPTSDAALDEAGSSDSESTECP